MSKLIFTSKTGGEMKSKDISQATKYFDSENKGSDRGSKIVIPEHMRSQAKAIEREFGRPVAIAPIRKDAIYVTNDDGV